VADKPRLAHTRYWRISLWLVAGCLLVWLLVTILPMVFVETAAGQFIFGWPLVFGLTAFVVPVIYLLIIGFYSVYMDRLERRESLESLERHER
jgi:putative solute:sodium symporter small subunit